MTTPTTGVPGMQIVANAQRELGDRYNFGATGPDQWDCSALVQKAYRDAGINLPRVTHDQVKAPGVRPITAKDLQPGDLVFSDWANLGPNSHVAIYAGDLGTKITGGIAGPVTIEARGSSATGKPGVSYRAFDDNARAHATAYRRVSGIDGAAKVPPSDGGVIDWLQEQAGGAWDWVTSGGPFQAATDPLGALNRIGDGMAAAATGLGAVGQLSSKMLDIAIHPRRYVMKGFMFFMGIIFILIGVYNLSKAARNV